ncbi:hypothetical protein H2509_08600 [Stappia sp. F7233]|uniref:Uncharacterized protein n=1 Tax=Stappia albiluteola TaxID=2758565 RepID=A0A839ADZ7_9HYPH|nr:hypothetical protein [Stappia albiluteola]MBA5777184.1 hypothetical protein [Stappia albiluteola]
MLLGLVGTLVLGIAVVGCLMFLNKLTGKRLPRWIFPAGAALGMLTFHIWNEYTWFDRTAADLPAHVAVAETYTTSTVIQPWTLVFPRINRYAAVDLSTVKTNDKAPGYRLAEVYLVTRFTPTAATQQIFDCPGGRRAFLGRSDTFGEDGLPEGAAWESLDKTDPMLSKVCSAPTSG